MAIVASLIYKAHLRLLPDNSTPRILYREGRQMTAIVPFTRHSTRILRHHSQRKSVCCWTSSSFPTTSHHAFVSTIASRASKILVPTSQYARDHDIYRIGATSLSRSSIVPRRYKSTQSRDINGVADLLNLLPNISLDKSGGLPVSATVIRGRSEPQQTLASLIEKLPRLAPLSAEDPLYIFLVSPAFAADLIGKDDLISPALFRVAGAEAQGSSRALQTLVAVVDKLPHPADSSTIGTARSHNGLEGISVTVSNAKHLSKASGAVHNWSAESSRFTHSLEPEKPATLAFSFEPAHEQVLQRVLDQSASISEPIAQTYSVQVSLSSTIFQNGLKNTLLHSQYEQSPESGAFTLVSRQEIQHARVALPFSPGIGTNQKAALDLPLYRMTAGTAVDSCMGNIIRSVRNFDVNSKSAISPASQNLEDAVAKYFKHKGIAPHALSVWALVIPFRIAASVLPQLEFSNAALARFWTYPGAHPMGDERLAILTDLLARGARICRVTSGGGGWGNKAGLLSLDPDTSFEAPVASFVDSIVGSGSDETSPSDGLPEIAGSGDIVQFYFLPPELLEPRAQVVQSQDHDGSRISAEFGVVPDTTDIAEEEETSASPDSSADAKVYMNHFGALSEKGMSITTKSLSLYEGKVLISQNQSKIDVPFSRFRILIEKAHDV